MTVLAPRQQQFATVSALLGNRQALAAIHADTVVPPTIADWLHGLALLRGVPLGYLVPDPTMLPPESIRFFQLDPNWVNALVEGACSLGRASSADLAQDATLAASLYAAAAIPPSPVTGFLLRSAVVEGWPTLEVSAFADAAETQPLDGAKVLRFEILGPSLLLFMVAGTIHHLTIHEPAEGLHFGVDLGDRTKELRYVTVPSGAEVEPGKAANAGDLIHGANVDIAYRDGPNGRVLQVDALAATMKSHLAALGANTEHGASRQFTAAEFALQLVEGAQSVRFNCV